MMEDSCAYCGSKLVGWYCVDYWGNRFCEKHRRVYPSCDYCGRLISPTQTSAHFQFAGRKVCTVCRETAVDHVANARQHFQEIIRWINGQGMYFNQLSLRIQFQNQYDLTTFTHKPAKHVLGAASRQLISSRGKNSIEMGCVAIRRGLPMPLFQGVLVHELSHVWCTVHQIISLPEWAEEGFSELVAYRYYSQLNSPQGQYYAKQIHSNSDPVYGKGFRGIKRMADQLTFGGLIKYLLANKELPDKASLG